MAFIHNDIVNKNRLRGALNEESSMGFKHNDIVTTYAMDKAIAEGGGGGGGLTPYTVTVAYEEDALPSYFFGGLEYGDYGQVAESVIKLSDKFYTQPSVSTDAGTYEITPLYEGGAGYFSGGSTVTITGDATVVYDEATEADYVKVTGDCSITFTAL